MLAPPAAGVVTRDDIIARDSYLRVLCEFVIVVFKIAENTKKDEII